jgi:hypothetical protein
MASEDNEIEKLDSAVTRIMPVSHGESKSQVNRDNRVKGKLQIVKIRIEFSNLAGRIATLPLSQRPPPRRRAPVAKAHFRQFSSSAHSSTDFSITVIAISPLARVPPLTIMSCTPLHQPLLQTGQRQLSILLGSTSRATGSPGCTQSHSTTAALRWTGHDGNSAASSLPPAFLD